MCKNNMAGYTLGAVYTLGATVYLAIEVENCHARKTFENHVSTYTSFMG
jgi:hypothetical protein